MLKKHLVENNEVKRKQTSLKLATSNYGRYFIHFGDFSNFFTLQPEASRIVPDFAFLCTAVHVSISFQTPSLCIFLSFPRQAEILRNI